MTGRGKTCIWFLVGLAAIVAGFWRTFFGDPLSNDVWRPWRRIGGHQFWLSARSSRRPKSRTSTAPVAAMRASISQNAAGPILS